MTETTAPVASIDALKKRGGILNFFIRLIKEQTLGTVGLYIFLVLLLTGIFADLIAPYAMNKIDLAHTLSGPTAAHLLGTDNLGRDVLSNLIYGARVSMIIGILASALSLIVSTALGVASATIGGMFDMILQRFVDAWMCIPGMMILLIMMSIIGKGVLQMVFAMAIPGGIGGSRGSRALVIMIKSNAYVEAEKGLGCPMGRLMLRHMIPNISPMLILMGVGMVGGMILMESGLSFLGYGVPPGTPSWGSMLSMEGRQYMEIAPALAFWPGFCLAMVIFGTNVFADAARDLLDPKLKGGRSSSSYSIPTPKKRKAIEEQILKTQSTRK